MTAKKFLMTMMLLALILTVNIEPARATIVLKNNPVAVVMPYLDKSTKSKELTLRDATWVSEYLIEELMDSGRFQIPEREYMQAVLNEHKINTSGLADPSTAVSVGNFVGAQYMIVGSIVGLSAKESGIDAGITISRDVGKNTSRQSGSGEFNKYTVIANITLRVIDLETGLIVVAAHGEGKSARVHFDFSLHKDVINYFGEDGSTNTTPPETGTNTTPPETGTNTTPPETGTNTTPPETGTNTTPPETGTNTTPPETGTNTTPPETGTNTTPPETGTNTTPPETGTNTTPPETGTNTTPPETGTNTTPPETGTTGEIYNEDGTIYDDKAAGIFNSIDFIPLSFYFDEGEGGSYSARSINVKFGMGSMGFGEEQVHNALKKAVEDAVSNKDYGLIAKLNGTAKKRKS